LLLRWASFSPLGKTAFETGNAAIQLDFRAAYLETAAPIGATPQDFRMEGSLGENWLASLLTGRNGSGGDGSLQAHDGEVVAGGAAAAQHDHLRVLSVVGDQPPDAGGHLTAVGVDVADEVPGDPVVYADVLMLAASVAEPALRDCPYAGRLGGGAGAARSPTGMSRRAGPGRSPCPPPGAGSAGWRHSCRQ